MKKLYRDRLLRTADILREVPDKHFSMEYWCTCGTKFCAVGWAAQDPLLKAEGLKLVNMEREFLNRKEKPLSPAYKTFEGWGAVEEFYGLDHDNANYLFNEEHYPKKVSKEEVIGRIYTFVGENK